MRTVKWVWIAIIFLCSWRVSAETAQTLDLKPFVKKSPIENMGADWLVPHGNQVLDGVPFKIDGAVLFHSVAQKGKNVGTNQISVPVGSHFERLHLLAATDSGGTNTSTVAKVHFVYADGSENVLDLNYGEHLLAWEGPWHKAEESLKSADSHIAWVGQISGAAQADKYLRFFHIALANPSPDKEVRELQIESANSRYGLLLLAMTVGPSKMDALPDTVVAPRNPFPDLRERHGQMARGEGIVKSTDGKPIANAIIRVSAVRDLNTDDGKSDLNAAGVGSGAVTDDNGHFILPPMADNKLYRLVIWAVGYEAARYRGLDVKSDPIKVRLKPFTGSSPNPKFAMHGRVVGPDGKPLPFLLVENLGVGVDSGSTWGNAQPGFPHEVLSDAKGEFTYGRDERWDKMLLKITGQDMAEGQEWVNQSNGVQDVQMGVGASIRGRVLMDGKPMTNLVMGLNINQQGNQQVWFGPMQVKTGTNGVFIFEHLRPNTSWEFYGKMSSFKEFGALPPRMEKTENHGQTTDLGDLEISPGLHLAGQIKTQNGEPLPKKLELNVGYSDAWDTQGAKVDKDGRFRFEGLAPRTVSVSFGEQSGWRLSRTNRSLSFWTPDSVTGILEEDKDNLLLIIERGHIDYNNQSWMNTPLSPDLPENKPLWGAEESGPPYVILAGIVLDDKTGEPIKSFKVVPGEKPLATSPAPAPPKSLLGKVLQPFESKNKVTPFNERACWQFPHTETFSNGTFVMPFVHMTSEPVLRIEADGYEPVETNPTNQTTTNFVLRLQRGLGPNGMVYLPNGNPASNATIFYAVAQEQFTLQQNKIPDWNFGKRVLRKTGADGKFSFEPRPEGMELFVVHREGWYEQLLAHGSNNLSLKLKPWAILTGTLVDSNNAPKPGVKLVLTRWNDWQNGGVMINIQNEATTDAQGNFVFSNVPPTRIEVQRTIPFAGGGWSYAEQTWLYAQPGTNDLGKVTLDTPPPPPAMERIKQSLGL